MKKYIDSYDGIRVIALLGVVFYHLKPSIFKGGYLGVVTFFVMAGYLTIKQAMEIGEDNNRTDLVLEKIKDKFIKLYPPLIFMISLVGLFIFFFFRGDLGGLSNDIKTALLSIYNYGQIFSGGSYFEITGKLAPFTHLWALSLEIQVYLFTFIFFYGNYKDSKKKSWFTSFFLLAILSYGLSRYLVQSGTDINRVYYASETRLYSFLFGAIAALLSDKKLELLSDSFKEFLISIFLLVSIGSFFIFTINEAVFNYIFPLYSLLIGILMILLRDSKGYNSRLLSSPPFKFISRRSYHIYLWHFPIIALEEKLLANTIVSNASFYLIFLFSCIILSEISHRLSLRLRKVKLSPNKILASLLILSLVIFIIPYNPISDASQEKQRLEEMRATILENEKIQREQIEREKIEKKAQEEIRKERVKDTQEKDFSKSYYNALDHIEWVNDLDDSLYLDPDIYTKYRQVKGLLIGDSMASMSYHTLFTYLPNFQFDSDHSRTMDKALEAYIPYMDEDFGDYIILSLGTNGDVKHQDIDRIREAAKDKKILLTTIVLPYKAQEEERNSSIRSYVDLHDNVYLFDWYKATKNRPELFFDDKIHTGERGARIMSQLIMNKIIEIETEK